MLQKPIIKKYVSLLIGTKQVGKELEEKSAKKVVVLTEN